MNHIIFVHGSLWPLFCWLHIDGFLERSQLLLVRYFPRLAEVVGVEYEERPYYGFGGVGGYIGIPWMTRTAQLGFNRAISVWNFDLYTLTAIIALTILFLWFSISVYNSNNCHKTAIVAAKISIDEDLFAARNKIRKCRRFWLKTDTAQYELQYTVRKINAELIKKLQRKVYTEKAFSHFSSLSPDVFFLRYCLLKMPFVTDEKIEDTAFRKFGDYTIDPIDSSELFPVLCMQSRKKPRRRPLLKRLRHHPRSPLLQEHRLKSQLRRLRTTPACARLPSRTRLATPSLHELTAPLVAVEPTGSCLRVKRQRPPWIPAGRARPQTPRSRVYRRYESHSRKVRQPITRPGVARLPTSRPGASHRSTPRPGKERPRIARLRALRHNKLHSQLERRPSIRAGAMAHLATLTGIPFRRTTRPIRSRLRATLPTIPEGRVAPPITLRSLVPSSRQVDLHSLIRAERPASPRPKASFTPHRVAMRHPKTRPGAVRTTTTTEGMSRLPTLRAGVTGISSTRAAMAGPPVSTAREAHLPTSRTEMERTSIPITRVARRCKLRAGVKSHFIPVAAIERLPTSGAGVARFATPRAGVASPPTPIQSVSRPSTPRPGAARPATPRPRATSRQTHREREAYQKIPAEGARSVVPKSGIERPPARTIREARRPTFRPGVSGFPVLRPKTARKKINRTGARTPTPRPGAAYPPFVIPGITRPPTPITGASGSQRTKSKPTRPRTTSTGAERPPSPTAGASRPPTPRPGAVSRSTPRESTFRERALSLSTSSGAVRSQSPRQGSGRRSISRERKVHHKIPTEGVARPPTPILGAARHLSPISGTAHPPTATPCLTSQPIPRQGKVHQKTSSEGAQRPATLVQGAARPPNSTPGATRPSTPKPVAARRLTIREGMVPPKISTDEAAGPPTHIPGAARLRSPTAGATPRPGAVCRATHMEGETPQSRSKTFREGAARPPSPISGAARPPSPISGAARPPSPISGAARPPNPISGAARPPSPIPRVSRSPIAWLDLTRPPIPREGITHQKAAKGGACPLKPTSGAERPALSTTRVARLLTPRPGTTGFAILRPKAARPIIVRTGAARPSTPIPGAARPGSPTPGTSRPSTPRPGAVSPPTATRGTSRAQSATPRHEAFFRILRPEPKGMTGTKTTRPPTPDPRAKRSRLEAVRSPTPEAGMAYPLTQETRAKSAPKPRSSDEHPKPYSRFVRYIRPGAEGQGTAKSCPTTAPGKVTARVICKSKSIPRDEHPIVNNQSPGLTHLPKPYSGFARYPRPQTVERGTGTARPLTPRSGVARPATPRPIHSPSSRHVDSRSSSPTPRVACNTKPIPRPRSSSDHKENSKTNRPQPEVQRTAKSCQGATLPSGKVTARVICKSKPIPRDEHPRPQAVDKSTGRARPPVSRSGVARPATPRPANPSSSRHVDSRSTSPRPRVACNTKAILRPTSQTPRKARARSASARSETSSFPKPIPETACQYKLISRAPCQSKLIPRAKYSVANIPSLGVTHPKQPLGFQRYTRPQTKVKRTPKPSIRIPRITTKPRATCQTKLKSLARRPKAPRKANQKPVATRAVKPKVEVLFKPRPTKGKPPVHTFTLAHYIALARDSQAKEALSRKLPLAKKQLLPRSTLNRVPSERYPSNSGRGFIRYAPFDSLAYRAEADLNIAEVMDMTEPDFENDYVRMTDAYLKREGLKEGVGPTPTPHFSADRYKEQSHAELKCYLYEHLKRCMREAGRGYRQLEEKKKK